MTFAKQKHGAELKYPQRIRRRNIFPSNKIENSVLVSEEGVLRGQELEDAISDANFTKAIQIAFQLRRPYKLFDLFAQICSILPPTEIIEIRGIRELLEGLIPYSQRHFSRIDRLERSTFLLDYTLTVMSVIELETKEIELTISSINHTNDAEGEHLIDVAAKEQEQDAVEPKDSISSKKRKLYKSRDVAHKKRKGVAYVNVSTVSSLA